jgi:hypothetical protein
MGSPYLPFPQINDDDQVQGMVKYYNALLYGGKCLGYEKITVDSAAVKTFTLAGDVANAKYAILFVDADTTSADMNKIINWREDGTDPTNNAGTNQGLILGDNSILEIKGPANLSNFKMIGKEAAKTHTVRVQYYGQG